MIAELIKRWFYVRLVQGARSLTDSRSNTEAMAAAGSEMAFRVEVDGMPYVRYDVGYVTQLTEAGSAGATWDGTASVTLTQARVKVAA